MGRTLRARVLTPETAGSSFPASAGRGRAMIEIEQLIQAAEQMADDDPCLPQARRRVRLRTLARLHQMHPNLDQANCTNVMGTVFENLGNVVQWVDENGVHIGNDEPAIRDALLSELRMVLCANLDQSPT